MDLASLLPHLLSASVVLVVIGIGLNATWQDALYLLGNPRLLLRSVLSMHVVMPLVAASLAVAFELPAPVKVALVALAISPVPPVLPKKELSASGHASYAIGLFFVIAGLAIVTVPITLSWFNSAFGRTGEVAPLRIAKVVLTSVLVPLSSGIALRRLAPALARKIARPVAIIGIVLLIVSALPLLYALLAAVRAFLGDGTAAVIAAMAAIGLGVGHMLGGPHPDDRTVLALSTASRHPAVALAVASSSGTELRPELAAILLYVIVAALISVPYVAWRKRQASAAARQATPKSPAERTENP